MRWVLWRGDRGAGEAQAPLPHQVVVRIGVVAAAEEKVSRALSVREFPFRYAVFGEVSQGRLFKLEEAPADGL